MKLGINQDYDSRYDHQTAVPAGFCPICGGEIYGPGGCLRCRLRGEQQEDNNNDTSDL